MADVQDKAGPDTMGDDTTGQDTAGQDTAGQDTAGPDTAGQDPAGPDTAGRDTAGQDSAGEDTAGAGFEELGLMPELVRALTGLGYEEPTAVQRGAIPLLLEGRDLLGQAATGTGKTAAFALPLLQRLAGSPQTRAPRGLVLVPTRELAMQVAEAVHKYGRELGVRVLPIYGGQPIMRQLKALDRGVDVVVATPGRALDHISRRTLKLEEIQTVVLDEADEMLDMGFADDIESILAATPAARQTLLFSATFPPRLDGIAKRHMRSAVRLEVEREAKRADGDGPRIRQVAYVVPRAHKMTALARVLDVEAPTAAIVFCRTRTEVDELTETMNSRGYRAEALHGGMSQEQRDRVIGRLRGGTADLLIATDVAARGLDFEQLTHVVNYDVPSAPDAYVHRIGRVGRAGREGVALTLAEPREQRLLRNIERVTGQRLQMQKVPTVADMRARRMELMRAGLREALLEEGNDKYRVVVEALADEFDLMDIAMAAVRMAHEASTAPDAEEQDVPDVNMSASRQGGGGSRAPQGRSREGRGGATSRIFIGAGRRAGIRPGDLVGAIANEAGLRGADIGILQIADSHSIVEVPESVAAHVIAALRGTTIKGRKTAVRPYKDEG
ncbi:MAG TPA: DEAD/DEAH box helicase [Longimicrobiales bacterium]|nr:DEAD/DEAH box helicase [Longimicrobiales bacterium]